MEYKAIVCFDATDETQLERLLVGDANTVSWLRVSSVVKDEDAQRLALARELAPKAFAVVDAAVKWNDNGLAAYYGIQLADAIEQYQSSCADQATPESEGDGK